MPRVLGVSVAVREGCMNLGEGGREGVNCGVPHGALCRQTHKVIRQVTVAHLLSPARLALRHVTSSPGVATESVRNFTD